MSAADFSPDERALIDAAIAAGRLTRIEQGEWPDVERLECWVRFDFQTRKRTPRRLNRGVKLVCV